jgi:hypothetical protein
MSSDREPYDCLKKRIASITAGIPEKEPSMN